MTVERDEEDIAIGLMGEGIIFEDDDDKVQPPVVLMYNWVQGYISTIHEIWSHQTSQGPHQAPESHWVAIMAFETSLVHGEHTRRRKEYTDCGLGSMRDGYPQCQIPDLGEKAIK